MAPSKRNDASPGQVEIGSAWADHRARVVTVTDVLAVAGIEHVFWLTMSGARERMPLELFLTTHHKIGDPPKE